MKRTEVLPLVLSDLSARVAKGAKQYGEPLTTHNGRDALTDAYEEALDLALYLRQAIEERRSTPRKAKARKGAREALDRIESGASGALEDADDNGCAGMRRTLESIQADATKAKAALDEGRGE